MLRFQIRTRGDRWSEEYNSLLLELSDLDWLHHVEESNSVLDELFFGQMLTALFCTNCCQVVLYTM